MRDIVATIQPEQDDIVRSDLDTTVCVQGAPGTGKTAVGLHRAAYLLYAHRDQLSRQGVLVVGPNASFLRYIADVLPALGEIDAKQTTVEELVAHVPVKAVDPVDVAAAEGRRPDGAGARAGTVVARRAGTRRPGRADGCAPLARPGVRGRRDRGGAAATGRPVRRRAGDAAATARAPDPGQDGAGRRLPRRPRAELGGAQQAGQGSDSTRSGPPSTRSGW